MSNDEVQEASSEPAGVPVAVPLTVGQRLRAAREAAGFSVHDVAQTLKYSARQIELIEVDNYAALPGITVVRGFVRSYARMLKLDATPLLQMLEERLPHVCADVRPPENMGAAAQPGTTRDFSLLAAASIVLILATSLLVVWHYFGPAPARPVTGQSSVPSSDSVVEVQKRDTLPAADAAASPVAVPTGAPAVTILPSDMRQLVLTFSDKSWIEIKDGSQRVILSGEFLGGDRQVASGKPPFQLWVGRASVVRVRDGEREIDLKPHARDEVARLTVD